MSWFGKLKSGLQKTSHVLTESIKTIVTYKKLDDAALEELEEQLIMADFGLSTTDKIIAKLRGHKYGSEVVESGLLQLLADEVAAILAPHAANLEFGHHPHVLMLCGVNGNGKTTTAGKIAMREVEQGKKVMLVACDTFRAAAVEQLEVWAQRSGAQFVKGEVNADPASVAYKAVEQAKQEGVDVVILDTAGRLHNKSHLMDELAKVTRVIKKVLPEAPHDTILVLDATTGKNAIQQVKAFQDCVAISGLIVTKLDSTAKGGIIVTLADEFNIKIHAIGVGEGIEDLNSFNPQDLAKMMFGVAK
jgi:fused signal recognition particle receptor